MFLKPPFVLLEFDVARCRKISQVVQKLSAPRSAHASSPSHTSPVCDHCQSVRLTLWPCCSADRQEMTSSALAKTSCESCSFFVYAWWTRAHEHHGLPFFQTETNDFPAICGNPVTVGLLVCYSIHRIIMYILCTLKYTLYYTSTLAYTLYHTYNT